MPHSLAQQADLTCPQCRRAFAFDVWLIVDAAERPDLLDQARAGALNVVTCPHCGHQPGALDAPLLIFRPGAERPLLFSPAQRTTQEQDREHATGLIGHLRDALGAAWDDAWVAEGVAGAPRALLAAELATLQQEDPEAYAQWKKRRAQPPRR